MNNFLGREKKSNIVATFETKFYKAEFAFLLPPPFQKNPIFIFFCIKSNLKLRKGTLLLILNGEISFTFFPVLKGT